MTVREAIVAEARAWMGTPWQHQQRRKGEAVDCVGLVIGVARALGLVAPAFDVSGYVRVPDGTLLARCAEVMVPVARSTMQPGDVVVIATAAEPAHMGIIGDYLHGGLSVIHASTHHMKVVEHRLLFLQNFRFKAAYALPGVD
jgi:cell wall-associated NlpC family hydrolase